jgi:large subunit ribosomal protein L6
MSLNPRTDKPVKEDFSTRLSAQLKEFSDKIPESAGESFALTEKIQRLVTDYVMGLDKKNEKIDVYKSVIDLLLKLADKSQGGAKVLILSSVDYWDATLRREQDNLEKSVSNISVPNVPYERVRRIRRPSIIRQDESLTARNRDGLVRTLVANMVDGVAQGSERRLKIQGVGYRAQAQGRGLVFNVGYSRPVEMTMPQGIEVKVKNNTQVILTGIDKELLDNTAAQIRAVRPPEPYKGKGVRYLGEFVHRKAGRTVKGKK